MRNPHDAFHCAIPARDLDEAYEFYVAGLGAKLARRYDDRITLDFFGDQVVCHLTPEADGEDGEVEMYPRHFGVTFADAEDFDRLVRLLELRKIPVWKGPALRFEGTAEEHRTLALVDPSRNVLEFKHYNDPRLMY